MTNEYNEVAEEFSPVLYRFTNKEEGGYMDNILAMFYEGVYYNQLGIMEAFNLDTEKEELILVGVEADDNNKPVCFPIAKILAAEDVAKYRSPDGKGGWFYERDPVAAADARESMRTIADATLEG